MIITYLMLLRLAVGRWGKIIFPKGNISPVAGADLEEGSRAECVTKKMRSSRSVSEERGKVNPQKMSSSELVNYANDFIYKRIKDNWGVKKTA